MSIRKGTKRESFSISIKPEVRALIDRAAEIIGKNRTDFMVDAAQHTAEDVLLDETAFVLRSKAYAAFVARLDAPPQPNERLRKTMQVRALWE